MGRSVNYYCPECKKKRLSHRQYRYGARLCFWQCFNRECNLRIEHPDRNAEISDYYSALDKMSRLRPEERITDYFLQNKRNVYTKGFEILYTGDNLYLVKHRIKDRGTCVGLYWRGATIDKDDDTLNPLDELQTFQHEAVSLNYRGRTMTKVIYSHRYGTPVLWKAGSTGLPFTGRWCKAIRSKVIEWAEGLDKEIVGLIEQAREKVKAWNDFYIELSRSIEGSGIRLDEYDFYKKKCAKIGLRPLTIEECYKLDEILPEKLKIKLINNKEAVEYVTTEQADAVRKLLKIENLKVVARFKGRLSAKKIQKVANALMSEADD